MTPYKWRSPKDGVERLFSLDSLEITIDVNIDVLKRYKMILGIGNDIVEIARIEKAIQNESFKKRVYTLAEIELIEKKGAGKIASYAGRFSAKEAISKAMVLV